MAHIIGPYTFAEPITLSDTADFKLPTNRKTCDAIYVGTGGDIVAELQNGTVITFSNSISGTIIPVGVKRVHSTNTGASNLLALFIN